MRAARRGVDDRVPPLTYRCLGIEARDAKAPGSRVKQGHNEMGRPKEPILDVQIVVKAALAMIDEHGLEGLSMRALGRELNVNPASLYHHFQNKDDILDAVREHIIRKANLSTKTKGKSWQEVLLALGKSYRSAMTQHPKATSLLTINNPIRTRVVGHRLYESVVAVLLEAGFSAQQSMYLLVAVETITSGSVMEEMSFGKTIQFGQVDVQKNPNLHAATLTESIDVSANFTIMLTDFIEGASRRFLGASTAKKTR